MNCSRPNAMNLIAGKSALVQVMAWWRQAKVITWTNVNTKPIWHMAAPDHNEFKGCNLQSLVTLSHISGNEIGRIIFVPADVLTPGGARWIVGSVLTGQLGMSISNLNGYQWFRVISCFYSKRPPGIAVACVSVRLSVHVSTSVSARSLFTRSS